LPKAHHHNFELENNVTFKRFEHRYLKIYNLRKNLRRNFDSFRQYYGYKIIQSFFAFKIISLGYFFTPAIRQWRTVVVLVRCSPG